MELIICQTSKHKKELLKFYKSQYISHPLRRDTFSPMLKGILFDGSIMNASIDKLALMVKSQDEIVMSCLLVRAKRMPDYLQISFFESKAYHKEAYALIYDKALEMAKTWGCTRICASLNIHVNYGLGFLADSYDLPQSFGMAHNDDHIHRYFVESGFSGLPMLTYRKDMTVDFEMISQRLRERLKAKYQVRSVNFGKLRQEASIYTRINNDAFSDHPFYYERDEGEDYELFRDFKYLLRPENLLFVMKDDVEVGFMLWYPDFNQIIAKGQSVGIKTVIKARLNRRALTHFKIVEMGVTKTEQGKGAILALFDYCFEITKGRFESFESGWVLKDNHRSSSLGDKWSDGIERNYVAYVLEL